MDADVDAIDISDDDDDDAGIFSIANDCQSEEYDASLAKTTFFQQYTKHTAVDKDESAEEFPLACEAVVRFVQDSITDAIDKQKRNADKHGRANALSFDEGDSVFAVYSRPTKTQ
uniref:Transcription factor CBF/NF-Y/archaeal histone domain-containing protein n=1 Tax=Peronospora matthiolae TaxID=2874970 RepID=A0AAV1TGZ8_9STRA